jgi:hypothetical protein
MSKTLEERLRSAKDALGTIDAATLRNPGRLATEVEKQFKDISAFASDVEHWLQLLEARKEARALLTGLEGLVDDKDCVPFGSGRVKYLHVRLLGVQAYLATKWALADRLVAMAGHVLCIQSSLQNSRKLPQLITHFISNNGPESKTAALAVLSLRHAFGWPIAISYALRNHFVHDGGSLDGIDLFDGPSAAAGFKISKDGWSRVEERARTYGVEPKHHCVAAAWTPSPGDDLRVILDVCEQATDDALGVLVGSACRSIATHVGFVFGED